MENNEWKTPDTSRYLETGIRMNNILDSRETAKDLNKEITSKTSMEALRMSNVS